MIKIEYKYVRLHKNHIACYRRLVTPLCFFQLKTKTYKYLESKRNYFYIPWPVSTFEALPEGKFWICKRWELQAKDSLKSERVYNDSILAELNLSNEQHGDNVLRIAA